MSTGKEGQVLRKRVRPVGVKAARRALPNATRVVDPGFRAEPKNFGTSGADIVAEVHRLVNMNDAFVSGGNSWRMLHRLKGLERISVIHEGVQAKTLRGLASHVDLPVSVLSQYLGLASSTMRRKAKEGEKLSTADSERVLGFVSLIGQVDEMLGEDRPSDFDAARWLTQWIREPHPALGGRKPDEMLDTTTGQSLVSDLLASIASGSYW